MIIHFEGHDYQWDPEKGILVAECRFIEKQLGMGLRSFNAGCAEGTYDCLRMLFYLVLKFNGETPASLDALDGFQPTVFLAAMDECYWNEAIRLAKIEDKKKAEAEKAGKGRAASSGQPQGSTRKRTPTSAKPRTKTSGGSPTSAT